MYLNPRKVTNQPHRFFRFVGSPSAPRSLARPQRQAHARVPFISDIKPPPLLFKRPLSVPLCAFLFFRALSWGLCAFVSHRFCFLLNESPLFLHGPLGKTQPTRRFARFGAILLRFGLLSVCLCAFVFFLGHVLRLSFLLTSPSLHWGTHSAPFFRLLRQLQPTRRFVSWQNCLHLHLLSFFGA